MSHVAVGFELYQALWVRSNDLKQVQTRLPSLDHESSGSWVNRDRSCGRSRWIWPCSCRVCRSYTEKAGRHIFIGFRLFHPVFVLGSLKDSVEAEIEVQRLRKWIESLSLITRSRSLTSYRLFSHTILRDVWYDSTCCLLSNWVSLTEISLVGQVHTYITNTSRPRTPYLLVTFYLPSAYQLMVVRSSAGVGWQREAVVLPTYVTQI